MRSTRKNLMMLASCVVLLTSTQSATAQCPLGGLGLSGGIDIDTDAFTIGIVALFIGPISTVRMLNVEAIAEFGTGSYNTSQQDLGYNDGFAKTAAPFVDEGELNYNVFHLQAHARYPVWKPEDSKITVDAIAGPALYRWMAKKCKGEFCKDNEFTLDIGAGVTYDIFGLDAYTRIGGDVPDFSIRAKVIFGM